MEDQKQSPQAMHKEWYNRLFGDGRKIFERPVIPEDIWYLVERMPFLQLVNIEPPETPKSTFKLVQSHTGWNIHLYGDVAMSASPGQQLLAGYFEEYGSMLNEQPKQLQGDVIPIQLKEGEFNPSLIELPAGCQVTLAVTRVDENKGMEKFACKAFNLSHELALNKVEEFMITTKKPGEYTFGNRQAKGKIVVKEKAPKADREENQRSGTIYAQTDLASEEMVLIAKQLWPAGATLVAGTNRMIFGAWVAAQSLDYKLDDVDLSINMKSQYQLIQSKLSTRIEQIRTSKGPKLR